MPSEGGSAQQKNAVLIVEDDQFLFRVCQVEFGKSGIEVWRAVDGKEAIAYFDKGTPRAVLLDLMLPGVSGFDVLAAMRKHDRWKSVPAVVLTNLSHPKDRERAMALGATEYYVKAQTRLAEVVERGKQRIEAGKPQ